VSKPVETINDELKQLIDDMFATMYGVNGIGLSAIQVGVPLRLFVVDITRGEKYVFINPEITWRSQETTSIREGCLSFPGVSAEVPRSSSIVFSYVSHITGRIESISAAGLYAICVQHEIDHLNGITFYDYLGPTQKAIVDSEHYSELNLRD
jgi:peptide deformylase